MSISKRLRYEIFRRDDFMCQYCRSRGELTIDHIVPRILGGSNSPENLVTACVSCNVGKAASLPNADHVQAPLGSWSETPSEQHERVLANADRLGRSDVAYWFDADLLHSGGSQCIDLSKLIRLLFADNLSGHDEASSVAQVRLGLGITFCEACCPREASCYNPATLQLVSTTREDGESGTP